MQRGDRCSTHGHLPSLEHIFRLKCHDVTQSVPLEGELDVLCDLVFTCLHHFVATWARNVRKHVLVTVSEALREFRLLGRTLYLGPLAVSDCLRNIVVAWTGVATLGNDPRLGTFRSHWLAKAHAKRFWLR